MPPFSAPVQDDEGGERRDCASSGGGAGAAGRLGGARGKKFFSLVLPDGHAAAAVSEVGEGWAPHASSRPCFDAMTDPQKRHPHAVPAAPNAAVGSCALVAAGASVSSTRGHVFRCCTMTNGDAHACLVSGCHCRTPGQSEVTVLVPRLTRRSHDFELQAEA
jgi:hypothetical protein